MQYITSVRIQGNEKANEGLNMVLAEALSGAAEYVASTKYNTATPIEKIKGRIISSLKTAGSMASGYVKRVEAAEYEVKRLRTEYHSISARLEAAVHEKEALKKDLHTVRMGMKGCHIPNVFKTLQWKNRVILGLLNKKDREILSIRRDRTAILSRVDALKAEKNDAIRSLRVFRKIGKEYKRSLADDMPLLVH